MVQNQLQKFLAHHKITPDAIIVAVFTAIYMLVSLIAALILKNPEFIFYIAVMCILTVMVILVHLKIGMSIGALWGLSIWGVAHMAGGLMPIPASWPSHGESYVLYNLWLIPGLLKYDQLIHAFGFGIVTWICWQALTKAFANSGVGVQPTFGLLSLCVAAGMGFGAANEVVEFIATILIPGTNVGGYQNTGWDLVANLVGCVIAAVSIRMVHVKLNEPV